MATVVAVVVAQMSAVRQGTELQIKVLRAVRLKEMRHSIVVVAAAEQVQSVWRALHLVRVVRGQRQALPRCR